MAQVVRCITWAVALVGGAVGGLQGLFRGRVLAQAVLPIYHMQNWRRFLRLAMRALQIVQVAVNGQDFLHVPTTAVNIVEDAGELAVGDVVVGDRDT
jgi:predicted alpha/beta hydrolase